jgi:DNA-binding transcriptional MerR regulator
MYAVVTAARNNNNIIGSIFNQRGVTTLTQAAHRLFSSQPIISAKLVKDLRAMTGSPLKDCMKVLDETQGDIEKAKELLRKRGLADAEKRTGRATAEGYVGLKVN